jgi:hypothetical protein
MLHYGNIIGVLLGIDWAVLWRIGETIKRDYPISQRLPLLNEYMKTIHEVLAITG